MAKNYSNIPFAPAQWPFFYGWMIAIFSALGIILSIPGQTMGVSAFTEHLLDALRLTRTELTFAYMLGTMTSAFMLTYAGKLYDIIGARVMACMASVGMGFTLILLSQADKGANWLYSVNAGTTGIVAMMSVGFFMLRFFGQGVLTLSCRNMVMKWFNKKRGFVTGISNPAVSLGFSAAPIVLNGLINQTSWQNAWLLIGLIAIFVFSGIVLIFFRDNPESCGLLPDGVRNIAITSDEKKHYKQYTLREAQQTFSFWVFALTLGVSGFIFTAVPFHVESIFKLAGMDKETAFSIFLPAAIISLSVNLIGGYIADKVKMKYLLYFMLSGLLIFAFGVIFLKPGLMVFVLILGNGLGGGMFGIIANVTFARFYGRAHLGAINGFVMSIIVFSSAIAPWLFSQSLDISGSYQNAALGFGFVVLGLLICAVKADNPQTKKTM